MQNAANIILINPETKGGGSDDDIIVAFAPVAEDLVALVVLGASGK